MVMKDKLYKSNHKGIYYKSRRLLIASAVIVSGFACVSVPTYINYKNDNKAKAEVEEKPAEVEKIEMIANGKIEAYQDEAIFVIGTSFEATGNGGSITLNE